jgi:hypothetical protein
MFILPVGYFYIKYKEKAVSLSVWIIYALLLCPSNLDKIGSTLEKFYWGGGRSR